MDYGWICPFYPGFIFTHRGFSSTIEFICLSFYILYNNCLSLFFFFLDDSVSDIVFIGFPCCFVEWFSGGFLFRFI